MLKAKGGRGFHNFSHLWDEVFGYWRGILRFIFLGGICCMLRRLVYSVRLRKDVRLFYFPLGSEVVFDGSGIVLLSLS
jgi:hypothetical protein